MEIAEIKSKLSISQVLDHYGIKMNKNRHCLCPFHDDKKPSMQVYPETNTVHCFSGNCEHTGKAIDQTKDYQYTATKSIGNLHQTTGRFKQK